MLTNLKIKNYALIEHLQMEPSAKLNIITGETGAGKSIMLGAIGLLLGNRADTKLLFNHNE
ncbi:MAG: AAA family ATPase, partial [Hymenobacteraceae bacterium]|nr:AAA family ATPase [Hymenobacteraceae bacterium]MDX5395512.1 AAA family ATPase [Hymenobacteraceae bacterium]MDX5511566.1 AAA family ATPase [Hymenobacteraceae bacterium]